MADVAQRPVVPGGDARRARLGVQAFGERLADGFDAPARTVARLQHDNLMAGRIQLISGGQPGQSRP